MEVRIKDGGGELGESFIGIPDNAEVFAEWATFAIFNAKPPPDRGSDLPKTTWGALRAAQAAISMR
jgi:hypothetical protein